MLTVAALYHFTRFDRPDALRGPLADLCAAQGVRGTLLLAREGINGTIAGSRAGVDAVLAHVRTLDGCSNLVWKESLAATMPFGRMKVRLKQEIVTMGEPDIDPRTAVGRYVEPADWNALIRADDVVVIDTRNDYEVAIGTFAGAVDPGTRSFRDFPRWWEEHAERFAGKRIAMFCTGGIRCEKSTSYLASKGVGEVFHLRGGILKYLEDVAEADSLWRGGCFVFDGRVSLGHGLKPTGHELCHACRRPLHPDDRDRPEYEPGASCHHCMAEFGDDDRRRFRERHRQVTLAAARGESHLGG